MQSQLKNRVDGSYYLSNVLMKYIIAVHHTREHTRSYFATIHHPRSFSSYFPLYQFINLNYSSVPQLFTFPLSLSPSSSLSLFTSLACHFSLLSPISSLPCSSYTPSLLLSGYLSLYLFTHQSSCGEDFTRASDVSSKYVAIIHCTTASRSLGHPCLVSLLFIYLPFFNSKNFLFTCLISFLLHSHAWCAIKGDILGHNAHKRGTLVLSYRLFYQFYHSGY